MKKQYVLIGALVASLGLFSACKKGNAEAVSPTTVEEIQQPSADLSVIQVDSVKIDTTWAVKDTALVNDLMAGEDVKPGLKAVVDVPSAEQSPLLANAVMEWINEECLGGEGDADPMDIKAQMSSFVKNNAKMEDGLGTDYDIDFSIRKIYENKNIVTFLCNCYEYNFGAAHPSTVVYGATFRKSDGKRFGWNMFRTGADLQPFLKKGLMEYFEVKTDDALQDNLMMDDLYSTSYLPKAQSEPWVTEDGITILYQAYEIACYAAGMPNVDIPLKKADKLLTATAKKLLE